MTLKEAEELFKELNGEDPYLIWHEAGEKTLHDYYDTEIPYDLKCRWTADLMSRHFAALAEQPEHVCLWHGRILDLMDTNYCDAKWYGEKLLAVMEYMDELDEQNRIGVIENMGSRLRGKDSGCKIFCLKTNLGPSMNQITEQLIRVRCRDEKRLREASRKYRDEYGRWGNI